MNNYPHLATRLFNTPLMARFDVAQQFAAAFDRIATSVDARQLKPEARVTASGIDQPRYAAYSVTPQGIGVLTIEGPLVQRAGQINPDCSPITSYQWINSQLMAMAADKDVEAILLEFDSPGGEVANVFELGTRISSLREQTSKPIWAVANEGAFSAGYALAVGAERILLPTTAMVGSIGVIMLHVDVSAAAKKKGYAFTPIFAGARKNDFSSLEPLSREALAIGQQRIDQLYTVFTDYVAGARKMDSAKVRGTEAGIFNAADAVKLGLADGIATFDEALGMLAEQISSKSYTSRPAGASTQKGSTMAKQDENTPASTAATEDQLKTARAEGVTEGQKAGTTAERARVKSILTSDAAKTRPTLAMHLAFESDMAPDAANAMLDKAAPEVKTGNLAGKMQGVDNPKVGLDVERPEGADAAGSKPRLTSAEIFDMRKPKRA